MKLKGINPFEQHIEKIVLGVAGAAFVGAMGYQFFVRGNDISVGTAKVPVSDAYRPAADAAKRLKDRVESTAPNVPEMTAVNLADRKRLGAGMLAGVAGTARTPLGAGPGFGASNTTAVAVDSLFAPVVLPVPTAPAVAVHRATIHPAEVILVPELASLLPAEQPFDKASVGIEVAFDGTKLKAALEADPDGAGPLMSIPLSWWRDGGNDNAPMIELLALEVERKTIRNADGSVPEKDAVVTLPAMPGRPNVLADWTANVRSAGDVPLELSRISELAEGLQRPEFYSVISGADWSPASEVVVMNDTSGGRESVLRNRIRTLDQRIKRVEKELGIGEGGRRGAGGASPRGTNPRGGNPGGGNPAVTGPGQPSRDGGRDGGRDSSGGGGGKGGVRGGPSSQPSGPSGASEERIAGTMRNLENWRNERAQRQTELEKLVGKKEATQVAQPDDDEPAKSFLENPNVRLWTNDMSAQPGAIYAYRARVVINNPMFGRNLKEEQKALGESSIIASDWTAWSNASAVDRDGDFFIVSADPQSTVSGRPTATAEMFVFYYGYYRNVTQSLTPGDQLAQRISLPELRFVDMDLLRKDIEAGLAVPDLNPLIVAKPPVKPATGTRPAQGAEPEAQADVISPLLKTVAPRQITRSIDAVFLGVRESLQANGTRSDAVIRDQDQTVRVLSPEAMKTTELYKRMKASADAAKEAERREPEPAAVRPNETRRDREEATPKSGGGGGG